MHSPESTPDDRRVAKLQDYKILDTPPELDFDELTKLVAQICKVPTAVISLVDKDRQWFKARTGTDTQETPRAVSFCTHTIQLGEDQLLVINDTHKDARFANNPLVTGPEQIRFYAGAPLITHDGYAIGALCAIDHQPRGFTAEEMDALKSLARQVMNNLELRRLQHAHILAGNELEQTKAELERLREKLNPTDT